MMKTKVNICEINDAAHKARQLNSLLCCVYENGCEGIDADAELIGLAFDLIGKVSQVMDKIEQENNK